MRTTEIWYRNHPLCWLLRPFSWGYRFVIACRRFILTRIVQTPCPVPLIVIGNITVGGVGKTPLVIALAHYLQAKGLRVGIVSRGYKTQIRSFPYHVKVTDDACIVGDEPLLLAQRTSCPVVIAPKRNQAVQYLLTHQQSQVILSDDGLQHYTMGRSLEIAVIDGTRGIGNGYCLPAGPLREPVSRLHKTHMIVVNEGHWPDAYQMHFHADRFIHLKTGAAIGIENLKKQLVAAVAGIGNPQRFFSTLQALGIEFNPYIFEDHHPYQEHELLFPEKTVVMTEKDAVKCQSFATDTMYYLPVEVKIDEAFWHEVDTHISSYIS